MNFAMFVQVPNCLGNLERVATCLFDRKWPLFCDVFLERGSINVLHDDEGVAFVLAIVQCMD